MVGSNDKIIKVGDRASCTKTATEDVVKSLTLISEDFNPIHIDKGYAENTKFGRCIAHGLFCLGMISKIIGMDMPGEGSIFLNEKLNYKHPVYIGDTVTAYVEIEKIIEEKSLIEVKIECINQKGIIVMDGTSLLKLI
ncbi:MAG: MaoC family dehydratase [Clostridiales bacterium]|nr:MaoC family dehydratase [Clostridiales bacterium]